MKIAKSRLKQIIQEELSRFVSRMSEQDMDMSSEDDPLYQAGYRDGYRDGYEKAEDEMINQVGGYGLEEDMVHEKEVNPWAVCHTTVDKERNPEKYERCVMDIKSKYGMNESVVYVDGKRIRIKK